jgi:hypothetical protein
VTAPGASDRGLPRGFYRLTLVAAFLTGVEIPVRALPGLPWVSLLEVVLVPTLLCLIVELSCRPALRARARALYRENRALAWYGGHAAIAAIAGISRSPETLKSCHDLFVAIALYALIGLTIDDHGRMRRLLAAALAGAMVNVGLGVLQIGAGGPYLIPLSPNIDAKLDLSGDVAGHPVVGLFNHPNALAIALLPVVLFLLVAAWAGFRSTLRRGPVMAALLAPSLVVLEMTYAKGVYAWVAAGCLFLVLPRRLDRHRVWLAAVVIVGGIAALTWFSLHAFLEGDLVFATIVGRIELWTATLDIVRSDAFVAAFGGGGSQLAHHTTIIDYANTHNAWLDQALTYGVPGFVLYLATYLTAFRSLARRIQREPRPARTIALATFASLVAILGESFFEPTNHGIVFQAQLFLLFAVAGYRPVSTPR